ncbi:MAG: CHAT domain-containing protein, partial [Bacteroidota bacterium]
LLAQSTISSIIEVYENDACLIKRIYVDGYAMLEPTNQYFWEIHNHMAVYYSELGDHYSAQEEYNMAFEILDQTPKDQYSYENEISLLQNMALNSVNLGDISEAISTTKGILKMCKDSLVYNSRLKRFYLNGLYDLGYWYFKIQEPKDAINYYNKCLELIEKNKGQFLNIRIKTLISLANAHRMNADPDKGLRTLQLAKSAQGEYFRKQKVHFRKENYFNASAKIYLEIGEYKKGIKSIKEALNFASKSKNFAGRRVLKANLLKTYAKILSKSQEYKEAELVFKKSLFNFSTLSVIPSTIQFKSEDFLQIDENILDALRGTVSLFQDIYRVSKDEKDLQSAYTQARFLIQLTDRFRQQLRTQDSHLFTSKVLKPAFEQAIKISLELYKVTGDQSYLEEGFRIAEKSKAVLLAHALNDVRAKYTADLPDSILVKERKLQANLSFYKKKTFREQNKIDGKDQGAINRWERRIFELEREEDQLQEFLQQEYPQYFELKYQEKTLALNKIQASLPANTLLLEYFAGDSALYIFSLDKSGLKVKTIEEVDALYAKIKSLRQSLDGEAEEEMSEDKFKQIAFSLYEELLGEGVEKYESILIIPDDEIGNLSFDLLLTEQGESTSYKELPYLFKSHRLQYAYSAQLLFYDPLKRQDKEADRLWAGFAPEFESGKKLVFNKQEVEKIREIIGGDVFVEDAANREDFLSHISLYKILHLATHASANMDNPQFSKIEFSYRDSLNDGILYSHELMNQRLKAEMVVLSACETGQGSIAKGEGIMSLAWAFRYAGTPSILMSLWKAESSVSERIMLSFYKNLKAGKSKSRALQLAKLEYIEKPLAGRSHPKYWSNFVLIGDPSPLFWNPWIKIAGIFALLLLISGFIYLRFRKTASS